MIRKKMLAASSRKKQKVILLTLTCLSSITPAFASVDPDKAARNILKTVFAIFLFGGIIMAGVGIGMLGKAISEGENAPPGSMGKGIAFLIVGIIFAASQFIVEKMFGIKVSTFSFFS